MLLLNSPVLFKISSRNSSRLPSNIPLRTFGNRTERDQQQSTSLLADHRHQHDHQQHDYHNHDSHHDGRHSSDFSDSDLSWTDGGDIAEQLPDADDPLRIRLADTSIGDDDGLLAGIHKRHPGRPKSKSKRVHFKTSFSDHGGSPGQHRFLRHAGVVNKEAIQIPDVAPRPSSGASRFLTAIMPASSKFLLYARPPTHRDKTPSLSWISYELN